jgi:hypothetical protein
MKSSHILNFSDWSLTEQGDPYGLPPIKGVTADSTRAVVPGGRNYAVGNEESIDRARALSPEEMRKRADFEASVAAFAISFVPVLGSFAAAALLSTQAAEAFNRRDYNKAGKDAVFAALSLAIPGLSLLPNLSRLGSAGVKTLQTKLDKGEKLYTSLELMGIEEIKQNPQLVAQGIEKAIAAKGIPTKGLNLEAAAKSAF